MGHVIHFSSSSKNGKPSGLHANTTDADKTPDNTEYGENTAHSLLNSLSFIRDALGSEPDAEAIQHCQMATETALSCAMQLERRLIHQALRLEEMARLANTDLLTGIYNRRGFEQEFHRVLSAATRHGETGALVFIDLDGFKPINDTYGHAAGDHVLKEVARVLGENLRSHDLVARFGGDEFVVLLTRISWPQALSRAEILKHVLNTHYVRWSKRNIAVRASLGVRRFGPNETVTDLLQQADAAMYQAKRLRATPSKR